VSENNSSEVVGVYLDEDIDEIYKKFMHFVVAAQLLKG